MNILKRSSYSGKIALLFLLALFFLAAPLMAQEAEETDVEVEAEVEPVNQLRVTSLDVDQFPDISFRLLATDHESRPLISLADLILLENDQPVDSFTTASQAVGVEVVFVIDANTTINQRDGDDLTRREEVRDSINRFATTYMNQSQLDRVWIVAPEETEGETAVLLNESAMVFPTEVINAINFYDPQPPAVTPLQEMLELALAQFDHDEEEQGRFRAILLFTDGDQLNEQLNFEFLVQEAQRRNVVFFAAILGEQDDPHEVENVAQLYEPTHGFYVHMPQPEDADPVYLALQGNGNQSHIQYRSRAYEAGSQTLRLELGDAATEVSFIVDLAPPAVQIVIDNSRPIRRVAPEADTPLAEMEPDNQPVVVQIDWPDGHPRELVQAALLVDDVEQLLLDQPLLDPEGRLTLDWNIQQLDEGEYTLVVQAVDELGVVGASDPFPLTIEISRPVVEPEEEAEAAVAPVEPPDESAPLAQRLGIITMAVGLLAVLFAFFLVGVAFFIMRRRRPDEPPPAPEAPSPPPPSSPTVDHEATQIMMPAFAAAQAGGAYLEVLENAPEHAEPIYLPGKNVAVGRDAKLAQVVLSDKSVSRLHARIMESDGVYRLYDEGSASGTYLNFERVSLTPQALRDNDDIHFGRVHMKFRLAGAAPADDSTQIMAAPSRAAQQQPAPADDDVSTQPYMPHQPQPQRPARAPQQPQPPDDDDPDDTSTQPYMPHSPRR